MQAETTATGETEMADQLLSEPPEEISKAPNDPLVAAKATFEVAVRAPRRLPSCMLKVLNVLELHPSHQASEQWGVFACYCKRAHVLLLTGGLDQVVSSHLSNSA